MLDLQEPRVNRYFMELYEHFEPSSARFTLCLTLFQIPFTWTHPMDENRAKTGKRFRLLSRHYCEGWMEEEASVLEVLMGMAGDLDDMAPGKDIGIQPWFDEMIYNLGLGSALEEVSDTSWVVEKVAKWTLGTGDESPFGFGGACVNVEIWYQMCRYIQERYL